MDERSWQELVDTSGPRLLLFARQYVPAADEAEAVVQEALVRLWRRGCLPEDNVGMSKLLYTCVRHAALDYLKGEARRRRREQNYAADLLAAGALFAPAPVPDERRQEIEWALGALPEDQRTVLTLKVWGGLTFEAIADVLQISPGTAASRHRLALDALRQQLQPEICHEPGA
jgi:RNA polymerase sigma-70 factor, ECF subfamily